MKSVKFWLLANLIKLVDEAFRGTAGSQEKTAPEPGLCDQVPGSCLVSEVTEKGCGPAGGDEVTVMSAVTC